MSAALLKAENLRLSFGGVMAVKDVSFEVREREVLSIIGANGAGKTTVLNLVSRLYNTAPPGRMIFDGEDITRIAPHDVASRRIARTFQNTELFDRESVLQNLLIARHVHRRTNLWAEALFLPSVTRQELEFRKVVESVIDLLDLQHYRDQVIGTLPYGARKMVEVARALCVQPRLLLLDEPSSGLNPEETEDVRYWIEDINRDLGVTIVIVEHDMHLVRSVSSRVMAMADGAVIAMGAPDDVLSDHNVQQAYLGE